MSHSVALTALDLETIAAWRKWGADLAAEGKEPESVAGLADRVFDRLMAWGDHGLTGFDLIALCVDLAVAEGIHPPERHTIDELHFEGAFLTPEEEALAPA